MAVYKSALTTQHNTHHSTLLATKMTRTPYFDKNGMRKGPWSKEEDDKLRAYIQRYGHWNWREIPRFAGVARCGKSCRLRWMNYLRPNLKHGNFTEQEKDLIIEMHNKIGNKWSSIAKELPGRSDNEIKNYWNTHLRKRANEEPNQFKNVDEETQTSESSPSNTSNNLVENSEFGELEDVEAFWASLSTEISSLSSEIEYPCVQPSESLSTSISTYSSSVELTSSSFSVSDCLVSSGDSIPTFGEGYDGNIWTDPFLADYGSTTSTGYSYDMDNVNGLMAQAPSDEFLWSTMDLYSEYHSQFMN